jgi:two-component sensor histidine kinase
VAPFGRVSLNGRSVLLKPYVAQTLALAIHELVTNAAKYGALSTLDGHVDITWTVGPDSVDIAWTEKGGPEVKAPTAFGFGSRVIQSVSQHLKGAVQFHWEPAGLICTLAVAQGQFEVMDTLTWPNVETAPAMAEARPAMSSMV